MAFAEYTLTHPTMKRQPDLFASMSLVRLLDDFPPSTARARWDGGTRAHGLDVWVYEIP